MFLFQRNGRGPILGEDQTLPKFSPMKTPLPPMLPADPPLEDEEDNKEEGDEDPQKKEEDNPEQQQ